MGRGRSERRGPVRPGRPYSRQARRDRRRRHPVAPPSEQQGPVRCRHHRSPPLTDTSVPHSDCVLDLDDNDGVVSESLTMCPRATPVPFFETKKKMRRPILRSHAAPVISSSQPHHDHTRDRRVCPFPGGVFVLIRRAAAGFLTRPAPAVPVGRVLESSRTRCRCAQGLG